MRDVLLQSTIDLSTSEAPPGQFAIAVTLLVVFAAIIIALHYRARYSGLPESNARHRAAITGSRRDQTPRSMYVSLAQDPFDLREDFRALFDGGPVQSEGRTTFRSAAHSVSSSFRGSLRPLTSRVSRLVVRLVGLAWLVAVFGAMAVSTEAVIYYLGGRLTMADVTETVDELVGITRDVLGTGEAVVASFPYGAEVWSLAFTIVVTAWEWAYLHWEAVSIGLLLLAAAVAVFEHRLGTDVDTRLYDRWSRLWALTVGSVVLVWLAGVVPASLGRLASAPTVGRYAGVGLAFLAAGVVAWLGVRGFVRRLLATADAAEARPAVTRAYLVARRAGLLAAIPASVLVLAYLAVLVATDKLDRLVDAYLAAHLSKQLAVLLVVVAIVAVAGYLVRESWPDVQQALRDNWSRARVRGVLLGRGVPFVGVAAGYLVAYSFTDDVLLGTVLAIVGGVVAYLLWGLLERAKYRVDLRPRSRRRPADVLVQAYRLEDADGDCHPFAVVNGRIELAHEDVDDVVDEVVDAVAAVQSGELYGPTLGTWRADGLLEGWHTDEATGERSARERARKVLVNALRPVGRPVPADHLERARKREGIPASVWRELRADLRGDVLVQRGDAVELVSDPWATGRRSSRTSLLSTLF